MSPPQQGDWQGSRGGSPVGQQDQEVDDADVAVKVEVGQAALFVGGRPAVQQCLEVVQANDTVIGQVGMNGLGGMSLELLRAQSRNWRVSFKQKGQHPSN
jgi:hypothetical protein